MDVAVKGLFWLLEACRTSPTFKQFIMVGGDAGMGHFVYPHPIPVTEAKALRRIKAATRFPKFSKRSYSNSITHPIRSQRLLPARAVDHGKDDFKYQLSFGEDVFGGPRWRDFVDEKTADEYVRTQTIPIML